MTDETGPVTAIQFEQLLQTALQPIKDQMGIFTTKDDLKRFATKDDLKNFATKDDLKQFATKDDMQRMEKDLAEMRLEMATKEDIHGLQQTIAGERQKTDKQFAWLRDGIDQTLIVLGNVEKKLETNIDNHEHRIKRLEKKVGLAQMAT